MSRIPQPTDISNQPHVRWRPPVLPADYSDEVTDEQLEALHRISAKEIGDEELELIDGPAW